MIRRSISQIGADVELKDLDKFVNNTNMRLMAVAIRGFPKTLCKSIISNVGFIDVEGDDNWTYTAQYMQLFNNATDKQSAMEFVSKFMTTACLYNTHVLIMHPFIALRYDFSTRDRWFTRARYIWLGSIYSRIPVLLPVLATQIVLYTIRLFLRRKNLTKQEEIAIITRLMVYLPGLSSVAKPPIGITFCKWYKEMARHRRIVLEACLEDLMRNGNLTEYSAPSSLYHFDTTQVFVAFVEGELSYWEKQETMERERARKGSYRNRKNALDDVDLDDEDREILIAGGVAPDHAVVGDEEEIIDDHESIGAADAAESMVGKTYGRLTRRSLLLRVVAALSSVKYQHLVKVASNTSVNNVAVVGAESEEKSEVNVTEADEDVVYEEVEEEEHRAVADGGSEVQMECDENEAALRRLFSTVPSLEDFVDDDGGWENVERTREVSREEVLTSTNIRPLNLDVPLTTASIKTRSSASDSLPSVRIGRVEQIHDSDEKIIDADTLQISSPLANECSPSSYIHTLNWASLERGSSERSYARSEVGELMDEDDVDWLATIPSEDEAVVYLGKSEATKLLDNTCTVISVSKMKKREPLSRIATPLERSSYGSFMMSAPHSSVVNGGPLLSGAAGSSPHECKPPTGFTKPVNKLVSSASTPLHSKKVYCRGEPEVICLD